MYNIKLEFREIGCENVKWIEQLKIVLNDGFVAAALCLHAVPRE
jgi:hypothetical protein